MKLTFQDFIMKSSQNEIKSCEMRKWSIKTTTKSKMSLSCFREIRMRMSYCLSSNGGLKTSIWKWQQRRWRLSTLTWKKLYQMAQKYPESKRQRRESHFQTKQDFDDLMTLFTKFQSYYDLISSSITLCSLIRKWNSSQKRQVLIGESFLKITKRSISEPRNPLWRNIKSYSILWSEHLTWRDLLKRRNWFIKSLQQLKTFLVTS